MPLTVYCTATLTAFSDQISYITYLFSEWHILQSESKMEACLGQNVKISFFKPTNLKPKNKTVVVKKGAYGI